MAHGLRTFFVPVDRSRGTGPRATRKGRVTAQAGNAGDRPPHYGKGKDFGPVTRQIPALQESSYQQEYPNLGNPIILKILIQTEGKTQGTGPRTTGKGRFVSHAGIAGDRPPHYVTIRPAFFLWKINRKSDIIKHIKSIGGTWR